MMVITALRVKSLGHGGNMNTLLAKDMTTWKISYNPYNDLFQIFKEDVFFIPDENVSKVTKGEATLLYEKATQKPLLVEFKNAYKHLGDIDNMSKESIIQNIIGYVKNYGR
jgi:hypothetical protein